MTLDEALQTLVLALIAYDLWCLAKSAKELVYLVEKISQEVLPSTAVKFIFINKSDGKEVTQMQITDIQTAQLQISIVDADKNPAALPAGVTLAWSLDDSSKGSIAPAPDGMSAVFTPNPAAGNLGTANVSVASSDGKLAGSLPVQIVASAATALQLSGVAVDAPAPAPAAAAPSALKK